MNMVKQKQIAIKTFFIIFLPSSIPSGASVLGLKILGYKNRNLLHILFIFSVIHLGRKFVLFGCRKCQPNVDKAHVWHYGRNFFQIYGRLFPLQTNNISDNKRQQTFTFDYKRLINGFVLTGLVSLQRKN